MILSDLLGTVVLDHEGEELGKVSDVRFVLDGPPNQLLATPRLAGLIVSPHSGGSFLGFDRHDVRSPWLVAALIRRRHRGSFLVAWEDVARVGADGTVRLREAWRRQSPRLPDTHQR